MIKKTALARISDNVNGPSRGWFGSQTIRRSAHFSFKGSVMPPPRREYDRTTSDLPSAARRKDRRGDRLNQHGFDEVHVLEEGIEHIRFDYNENR